MSMDGKSIFNLIKSGKLSESDLRQSFASASAKASSGNVSVQDWGACYNSGTGQLSEYCTVISNDSNNPITGIGMIAYSSDGSSMYCVQYTNDFSSPSIATSIGTTLYNPQDGNQVLCIVYGWTANASFYFTNTITIVPCQ
jgi:hypothetical protein